MASQHRPKMVLQNGKRSSLKATIQMLPLNDDSVSFMWKSGRVERQVLYPAHCWAARTYQLHGCPTPRIAWLPLPTHCLAAPPHTSFGCTMQHTTWRPYPTHRLAARRNSDM